MWCWKDRCLETLHIHFPLIIQEKTFSYWGEGLLVFSLCQIFVGGVFGFFPPLIQGEIQDCVLYQPAALPKPDIGFVQRSELILEALSVIFIRHHSETCLASGSTIILKLPLDSLDVVTEVHIS